MRVRIEIGAKSLLNPSVPEQRIKQAQMWLDETVKKDCDPYVPFRTGILANSVIRHTIIGSGQVVYETPYAEKVYNSSGWNFNKTHHPLAQDHWAEPVIANNRNKYHDGVAKILLGRGYGNG